MRPSFDSMTSEQLLEHMDKLVNRLTKRLKNWKVKSKLGKKGKKSRIPGSGYFFQTESK